MFGWCRSNPEILQTDPYDADPYGAFEGGIDFADV
jgi:hypothetical protein